MVNISNCLLISLRIRNSSGDVVWELEQLDYENIARFDSNLNRSQIVDKDECILINGALHVDLLIQPKPNLRSYRYPPNPLANKILALHTRALLIPMSCSLYKMMLSKLTPSLLNAPVLAEFFQNSTTILSSKMRLQMFSR